MDFTDLGDVTFEVEFKRDGCDSLYKAMSNLKCENKYKKIDFKVIINPPAVILFKDGKKYVAKAQDEPFNAERGLTIALLRSFGIGYSDLQKMLKKGKWVHKYDKSLIHPDTFQPLEPSDDAKDSADYGMEMLNKLCDETMIKRPIDDQKQYINANSIDNDKDGFFSYAMKVLYGNRGKQSTQSKNAIEITRPKPKRGRPRKVVKDETPKPKRPVGRPVKLRVGDEVEIIPTSNGRYAFGDISSEDLRLTYYIEFIGDRFLRVGNTDNCKSFIVDRDEVRLIKK